MRAEPDSATRSPREIARVVILTCVALVALALVFPAGTYAWHPPGTFGLTLDDSTGAVRTVRPGSAAAAAGLVRGDRIEARSLAPGMLVALRRPVPGTRIVATVRTPGGAERSVVLIARAGPMLPMTARVLVATEEIAFLVFLAVGYALAVLRPGPMTLWLFAYCLGVAPLDAVLPYDASLAPGVALVTTVAASALLGGWSVAPLVPFLILFPTGATRGWRRRSIVPASVVALAGLVPAFVFAAREATGFQPRYAALDDLTALSLYAIAAAVLVAGVRGLAGQDRQRVRYAALGMGFAFTAQIFDYVPWVNPHVVPAANTLAVVMPLAIAYAVVRHRVIDVKFFVDRAAIFAAITAGLVVTVGLVDYGSGQLLGDFHLASYFTAAASVGIGVLFGRIQTRCRTAIERVLFRSRYAADERLVELGHRFRDAVDVDAIARDLACVPCEVYDLTSAAVYRLGDGELPDVRFDRVGATPDSRNPATIDYDDPRASDLTAARDALRLITGELAIPMFAGFELAGFALFGPHRSGARVDPGEAARLDELVFAASSAFAHAEARRRRAEIAALRRRDPALGDPALT